MSEIVMRTRVMRVDVPRMSWIKCSERLPDDGYYLTCVDNRFMITAHYTNGLWKIPFDDEKDFRLDMYKPTHWMELPDFPNEDKPVW